MASLGGLSNNQMEVVNNGAVMLQGADVVNALMAQGSLDNSRVIQNQPGMKMAEGSVVKRILAEQQPQQNKGFAQMLKDNNVDMKTTLENASKPENTVGNHTANLNSNKGKGWER